MKTIHSNTDREKIRAANVSITSNLILTLLKFIVGILTGAVSIISEAIHSLNDLLASLIARYAVGQSSKPPDEEHRYGHGKIEDVSALIEGMLILFAVIFILYESIGRIISGKFEIEIIEWGIVVMLIAAVANFFVSQYLHLVAKKTNSSALEADALHLRTDIYTSLGVFLGLIVVKFTGILILDSIIAIGVAILIVRAAVKMILKSGKNLMDIKLPKSEEDKIIAILDSHREKFIDYHKLRTRSSGAEKYIDVHIVFPKQTSVEDSHNLAGHIKSDIIEKIGKINVIVHIEPCNGKCEICENKGKCN
ncbi:MAG: cation transporter [Candidatus Altiarchaeales archaeon HGW-Altiarchaeales-1]|nr:MAG: cation transporter [Candidatus Altiarchaeales archaeon HGW-Altiarchaeales-1]